MRVFALAGFLFAAALPATTAFADNVVAVSNEPSIRVEDLKRLAAQGHGEYQRIARLLGLPGNKRAWISVEDVDVSYARHHRPVLVTGVDHVRNGQVPLAHELTHILAGRAASHVLAEGFAVYMQDRIGTGRVFPNYGREINAGLRENVQRWNIPVPKNAYGFAAQYIGEMDQMRKRIVAYHIAGSFCRYLIEVVLGGDVSTFMNMYRSGDFQAATGKSRDDLIADWRKATL